MKKGLKISQEECKFLLKEKTPFIEIKEDYVNQSTKILFFCKICNKGFNATLGAVLANKKPCPYCRNEENKKINDIKKLDKINNFKNKELINGKYIFFRYCPNCNNKNYHSTLRSCIVSDKRQLLCSSCASIKSIEIYGNSMKGKSVKSVWEEKYGEDIANELWNKRNIKTSESVQKSLSKLSKIDKQNKWGRKKEENNFYGRAHTINTKEKISRTKKRNGSSIGEKNSMYGKPSPQGSGNGWSGWYKGIYFRSLLELSYLKYLIDNNINFDNGEKTKYRITYFNSIKNRNANYFPDFYLIDTQEIIEVKPKKLVGALNNIDKHKKAKELYGDKFKILTEEDIIKITNEEIKKIYDSKDLIFIERYDLKFKENYKEVYK